MTARQIRYRGQLYVLADMHHAATPHEKCSKGTHWNESQHKCMKLPPALARAVHRARGASKSVSSASTNEAVAPVGLQRLHQQAAQLHDLASVAARKHGFHELMEAHAYKASRHRGARSAAVSDPEPVVHVTPHNRCATGTHWNEDDKKCLPLPASLERKRKQARALTEKARDVSHELIGHGLEPKDAPRGTVHKTAIGYHQDGIEAQRAARNAHADLQDLAFEHGFNELSQRHEQQASRHHERLRRHKDFLKYIDTHPNIAHPLFADDPEHR